MRLGQGFYSEMKIPSATCSAAARMYLSVSSMTNTVRNYIPKLDSLNNFFLVYSGRYYADFWTVTKREATEPSKQPLPSSAAHHVRQHCEGQQAGCRSALGCLNIHSITTSHCKKLY